jgi:hypothetical protein
VAKVIDSGDRRLVIGWAYVARKPDGTLARDSGGIRLHPDGRRTPVDTGGDIIDTPEALRAFEDKFYDFLGSASAGADDMHVDFDVAKVVGGIVFTPDLIEVLNAKGVLPIGALAVIRIPDTPRGNQLWSDVRNGKRRQLSLVMSVVREQVPEAA